MQYTRRGPRGQGAGVSRRSPALPAAKAGGTGHITSTQITELQATRNLGGIELRQRPSRTPGAPNRRRRGVAHRTRGPAGSAHDHRLMVDGCALC